MGTKRQKRISTLLEDVKRNPNDANGLEKPERLKENYQGYLSSGITSEHRLVYKVLEDIVVVAQCKYHY